MVVPPPCVLTGADGENPDDCTTHDHEPITDYDWDHLPARVRDQLDPGSAT